ncbi:Asp23/Gls24 family envelope stress response protein [Micromonospora sp. DSM 115977]|uniref:Asp23/Gls24 family envelope stress response protein n=1 Tax=Micromonospora reichwaldensis TaxID=3075516 RepID=A0ABU2WYE3_9ACTN|nr:Asp23/Gls24 family envelope stress response protein [Micromonospora sp. DSM 115977]MDT0530952.1 Asp23/Gls24 family envelope stress response protein [Micromonospora sp. DSM 115977]
MQATSTSAATCRADGALDDPDRRTGPPPLASAAEIGRITIADRVVEKIAAQAVLEIPDAGGAAPRVFGHAMPGAGHLGIRRTGLRQAPKASADVDGRTVYLDLAISTRWPASIVHVSTQVREHVQNRVHDLTGLTVAEIRISVTGLITASNPTERVRP